MCMCFNEVLLFLVMIFPYYHGVLLREQLPRDFQMLKIRKDITARFMTDSIDLILYNDAQNYVSASTVRSWRLKCS